MLEAEAIDRYTQALSPEQAENVAALRRLLERFSPGMTEEICDGKWYNGLLTYKCAGSDYTIYALGPLSKGFTTFHMMPYYASAALQKEYGPLLTPFLRGKSCIKFKRYTDLPEDALRGILDSGVEALAQTKIALNRRPLAP